MFFLVAVSDLISSLSENKIVKKRINGPTLTGSTVLHVRRSDYLKIDEELKNSFYIEAIQRAKNEIDNFHYSVFTDDYTWVKNNKIFNDADEIVHSSNSVEDKALREPVLHFVSTHSTSNFGEYIV